MSEHPEMEQDLVELALGEVAEPRRSELLSHLSACQACREAYAEIVAAIDATVPAAPEAQPPAGFDLKVLHALGIGSGTARPVERIGSLLTPRRMLAAAAVALVAGVGAASATVALLGEQEGDTGQSIVATGDARDLAEDTVALHTGDGSRVGTASLAWMDESRVLVVSVSHAPVDVRYSCRVSLAWGGKRTLGHWQASSENGGTWVMQAPQGELNSVELVTDDGTVWSAATLP